MEKTIINISFLVLGGMITSCINHSTNSANKNRTLDSLLSIERSLRFSKDSLAKELEDVNNINNHKILDYSKILKGKFILDEDNATCAGYTFLKAKDKIVWTNEMACSNPDTFSLVWISNDVFLYRDINSPVENVEDRRRTWLRKVISFNGNNLLLKEYYVGGAKYSEHFLKFRKYQEE